MIKQLLNLVNATYQDLSVSHLPLTNYDISAQPCQIILLMICSQLSPDRFLQPLHRGSGIFYHNLAFHRQYLHQSDHKSNISAQISKCINKKILKN